MSGVGGDSTDALAPFLWPMGEMRHRIKVASRSFFGPPIKTSGPVVAEMFPDLKAT